MFESRPRKVSREYIVVVSSRKDSKKVGLPSVDHIVGGMAYYVARVAAFRDGVYSNVDWLFDKVAVLHRAVCIATVGRNGGGHVTPRAEHYPALDQINAMLASGAYTLGVLDREGGMSMQYEAEHLLPQLVTCETTARSIPATALAMYSQAKRTKGASKWSAPLLIGDDVRMTQGHSRATVICHWAVRRSKSKVSHPPPPLLVIITSFVQANKNSSQVQHYTILMDPKKRCTCI